MNQTMNFKASLLILYDSRDLDEFKYVINSSSSTETGLRKTEITSDLFFKSIHKTTFV